jgi:VWFA-related protein
MVATVAFLTALGWLGVATLHISANPASAKKKPPQNPPQQILRAEANMVLVDVIVTDKHGNYLSNLKQKDFHVFEDGKEQPIVSFSLEAQNRAVPSGRPPARQENAENASPGAPHRRRFIVIFIDDPTMSADMQLYARQEAVKFVESTSLPDRLFAVIDYDITMTLTQDFTADKALLSKAIERPRLSIARNVHTDNLGMLFALGRERLRALRALGKFLGTLPGRKTIIYLANGIPLMLELRTDFEETIDALNRANVGVYTIDARGLLGPRNANASIANPGRGASVIPIYPANFLEMSGRTGAFAFASNNDIKAGMEKASHEIDEAYILGYMQPNPLHNGAKHKIRVTVNRSGSVVQARDNYVDAKSPDFLATEAEGKALEALALNTQPGQIPITLAKPYFYVKPDLARVNLRLSIPGSDIEYKKNGDSFEAHINILGIAYRDDGSVATRFSDTVGLNYEKDEKQEAGKHPYYYENSFKIPTGEYTFKLVLTAGGEKFGKYVVPLIIEPFSGKQLTLSGPAFGDAVIPYPLDSTEVDPDKLGGSVPMNALGAQVVPSSSNHLEKDRQAVVYVEIYDPLLADNRLHMGFLYDIKNLRTNQKVHSSNTIPIDQYIRPGKPLVPVIFNLPMNDLPPGDYKIVIQARDSAGNVSESRTGYFSVE